jgi:hypothetical protein
MQIFRSSYKYWIFFGILLATKIAYYFSSMGMNKIRIEVYPVPSEPPMTYVCEPSLLSVILLGVASQIKIFGEAPQDPKQAKNPSFFHSCGGGGGREARGLHSLPWYKNRIHEMQPIFDFEVSSSSEQFLKKSIPPCTFSKI